MCSDKNKKRRFKYYPEDFGALPVKVLHMDLDFDVYEDHTVVDSTLIVKTLEDLKHLDLNAKNLEILAVESEPVACSYEYLKDKDILRVKFEEKIEDGVKVLVKTRTICRPTDNILEGLYYDETPSNCPRQQITQCQQWGFQRIVPCIDDMTAKCTYKTRITADESYTNLLTNGDVSMEVKSVGEGRVQIKYDNVITPMATYLFFLGVGTYATFKKEFEYPDGSTFMLELLVPPDSDREIAEKALQVLNDAIMWVYLFTGPDKYQNWDKALKIKELVERRDAGEDVADGGSHKIREELKNLIGKGTWGYKYTGTVYREIGMQNSDFGGMENVGNTTITTNRIMPFEDMTDGSFEYMIRVKVHEYYHNLNGSEVTGRSPFEIWLNEAVTVFIEQEYHEFLFGKNYSRLDSVLSFLAPGNGTFAGDDRANAMPIEPDGFNDCNELITGVTYVKAPEFVKMIETLMGAESFVKGLDLYHRRYKHGNASRAQWVEAMEDVSGMDFQRMAQVWLKQSSYPKIKVESSYKNRCLTLSLEQSGYQKGMHWEFPFICALVDENGHDIAEKMLRVVDPLCEIKFEDVDQPAFISLNRNYAVFGKVLYECSDKELYLQVRKDSDMINRYMAFYQLAEKEKLRLLEDAEAEVSEEFRDLYFEMLNDADLMAELGTEILTIFQSSEDERFAHAYRDLYEVVKKIAHAVAEKYENELLDLYEVYSAMEFEGSYVEVAAQKIKARQVKNTCLGLLARLDKEAIWKLIKAQLDNPECASDRITAFSLYLNSSAPDKMQVLDSYQKFAEENLVRWEGFLATVAGCNADDCVEIVKAVEKSKHFRIEQANDQRALYCRFAMNRKISLLTEQGRAYLEEIMLKLAPVNEYSCGFIVNVFGNIDQIAEEYRADLVKVLVDVKEKLSSDKTPSIVNNIERILEGSPKGMEAFKAQ